MSDTSNEEQAGCAVGMFIQRWPEFKNSTEEYLRKNFGPLFELFDELLTLQGHYNQLSRTNQLLIEERDRNTLNMIELRQSSETAMRDALNTITDLRAAVAHWRGEFDRVERELRAMGWDVNREALERAK